jgi:hypothetical protein
MQRTELSKLSSSDVFKWVSHLGPTFAPSAVIFQNNSINGQDLMDMEKADFDGEFGRNLTAFKLWKYIKSGRKHGVIHHTPWNQKRIDKQTIEEPDIITAGEKAKATESKANTTEASESKRTSSVEKPEVFLWKQFIPTYKDRTKIESLREVLKKTEMAIIPLRHGNVVFYGKKEIVETVLNYLHLEGQLVQSREFMACTYSEKGIFVQHDDFSNIQNLKALETYQWTYMLPFSNGQHIRKILLGNKAAEHKRIMKMSHAKISLVDLKDETQVLLVGSVAQIIKARKEISKLV